MTPIPLEPVTPARYSDASQEDYHPAPEEQDLVHESVP